MEHEKGDAEMLRKLFSAGIAAQQRGMAAEGLALLRRAFSLQPADADAWFARGTQFQQLGANEEAVGAYREALRARAAFPEALSNCAAALRALRRLREAEVSASAALELRPQYPRALNNRGLIALDLGRGSAAVQDFQRALQIEPAFPEALHNLGTALMQLKRHDEAHAAFATLLRLAPQFPHAAGNALFAQLCDCDWRDLPERTAAVKASVQRDEHAATPMSFLCMEGSAALQLRCARAYTRGFYPAGPAGTGTAPSRAGAKIRVAYLSGDLGEHAVSYLLAGVLEQHDAARFESYAIAWGRHTPGAMRQRLERAFTRFIAVDDVPDDAVVRLLRELRVDIAVDLCGHTEGQRTRILAQRAAPIQVNFLGLPATMGADYIDYLIADPYLVPAEQDAHYAERIVRLAGGFQPNDDRRALSPGTADRAALGLPADALVLCSFNRNCKITPALFTVWMRLLHAVPGTVLWLLASGPAAATNLRRAAAQHGIAADRLVFSDQVGYADYLARYRQADLFLDTAPFNGGATVSDALSMSLPVLTLAGESFAGRMAGSALTALGLGELIASSPGDYEARALALLRTPERLRALRQQLERARATHPFFDTNAYRVRLEAAYEAMVSRYRARLAPAALAIGPGH